MSDRALRNLLESTQAELEQGDAVRESWSNRLATLERALQILRTDQQRLQSQLERPPADNRTRTVMILALGAAAVVALVLAFLAGA